MACETCDISYGDWRARVRKEKIECEVCLQNICEILICKECGIFCDHCDSLFCCETCADTIAKETHEYTQGASFDDDEIIPGTLVKCGKCDGN